MSAFSEKLRQDFDAQTAPLRARFEALQPRERLFVGAAAIVVALALVYAALWQPFAHWRQRKLIDLEQARNVAAQIEVLAAKVQSQGAGAAPAVGRDVALLTAVDQAAKSGTLGKAPSRLQPDGESQVRVWIEDVQFDSVVRWMNELQARYGLRIDAVDFERRPTAGLVNARLTVVRA